MRRSVMAGIVSAIVLSILAASKVVSPNWQQIHPKIGLSVFGFSLIGGLLYHSFCEGLHGASLGKVLCRLRVVKLDGTRCSLLSAFIRNLAYFWDTLFFGMVGYHSMAQSPINQRYGDRWAGTVVYSRHQLSGRDKSIARFFVGFFLGSIAWITLLAIPRIFQFL